MIESYTESIPTSEPIRQIYADSVQNAIRMLRDAAKVRREARVTPETMNENREAFRAEYAEMLGIDVCQTVFGTGAAPLDRSPVGEDALCIIERCLFRIADGVTFTGLLLTPRKRAEKTPLVVMAHGGGGSPELCTDLIGQNNYGGIARRVVAAGASVFAPQWLLWSLGSKTPGIPTFATRYDRRRSDTDLKQSGASIAGFEIYELSRALDTLTALPGVDGENIGMCGPSYGGFYTLYTMAYETRIKSGWSAAFFNDRTVYDWQDFVWKDSGGRFLDTELAGLCAPRRLWIDVGTEDAVFNNDAVAELFPRVHGFYEAAGVPALVVTNRWEGGHRFSDGEGKDNGAFRFFMEGIGIR